MHMAYNPPPNYSLNMNPAPSAAVVSSTPAAPVDTAALINAILPVLGGLASKVATYVLLNKDPDAITSGDTALLLEAGNNDPQLVNAIAAGVNPQDILLRALSQSTFSTLQLGNVTKALNDLGKAIKATGGNTNLLTELQTKDADKNPIYQGFDKFLNP
jgi:hypothetical protein